VTIIGSRDEDSTLAIQIRGIFNELQLQDLKKKTLRGQMGQKQRGFAVGERTFGKALRWLAQLNRD
jgi:hypothetical protein